MRRVAGFRQSAASRAGRRKRAAEAARAAALPASAGRKARSGERREAILAAALDEFSSRGFEAARLEDVARRAGVAKGTIYLYFRDKENLFQELIRAMLTPLVGTIEAMGQADVPLPVLADRIVDLFVSQVYDTRRKDVVRLMISEGRRFPKLAEFYYREVLSRIIAAVRALLQRAAARGEVPEGLADFPQIIAAPGLVAIVWNGLFERFEPLDVRKMMKTHLDLATLVLAGCDNSNNRVLQGWVEAELVFVSPDEQGRVETLKVREGDHVKRGDLLFTVDDDLQKADVVVRNTAVVNAQQSFDRAKELLRSSAGTQKTYDDAEAALRQAKANLEWAQTRLARRNAHSPVDGTIEQIYYRPGETVPAGRPVVALLPPGNLKIRFFAPQSVLPELKYGDVVGVSCDGCDKDLTARISFIARSAEFTPPVIYSQEERAKLVFLIEARPERPEKFRVGQPVTVTLPQGTSK